MRSFQHQLPLLSLLLSLSACGGSGADEGDTGPDTDVILVPGAAVTLSLGSQAVEKKSSLDASLADVAQLDAQAFASQVAVPFEALPYDPSEAVGLDLIANSSLGLTEAERAKIAENGFVISTRNTFPTFTYGYTAIYGDDLPLYVSADSILYALHTSYDNILKTYEQQGLLPELQAYIAGMRKELSASSFDAELRSDLDVFLSVAHGLLVGKLKVPADAKNESLVKELYEGCVKAKGATGVKIFGVSRRVDFSQCTPRGHYTDSEQLTQYFRAMMWLGRIDFRMIETQEDGSQLFHRRQVEAALALSDLMNDSLRTSHKSIDDFVTAFVGEHDYMTVPQLADLMSDLQIESQAGLSSKSDEEIAQAIVEGGYGTQRISSHYMVNGMGSGTLPLSSSFALFGQRYVLDSHVFSNVVFDRAGGGAVGRMMPDPLDVAYAALANDQAGMLLNDELTAHPYAPDLASMRLIADSEPAEFWNKNFYNSWLGSLRTLSPGSAPFEGDDEALPSIAKTEAWGRRILNTQLASWAELRHDTILYVKQSYSAGISCEFPDAYVEPYPEFFASIEAYAQGALSVIEGLNFAVADGERVVDHFENFSKVAGTLREMAEHQRTGTPHSAAHMEFINQTVSIQPICGGGMASGWYPELFYGDPLEWAPTIADVHTQPMDQSGAEVGRILHVGTGDARLMVTTVETCSGPRAYAGLVSSYYEHTEEDWKRLNDPEWEQMLREESQPQSPDWVTSLLAE